MSPNARIVQSDTARQRQAMRDLNSLPWAPRPGINLRALGWACVTMMILSALLGLMAVGS